MSYKIEKEGFEYKGFKLGDYIGSDKIIGFDYKYGRVAVLGEYTVKCAFIGDEDNLDDVSVILEGNLHKPYEWIYIKTLTPKTIHLRHAIWDATLIVQCITCKPFEPVKKDGFTLRRNYPTRLEDNSISIYEEKGVGCYTFSTPQEAQAYLDKLLELVNLVNEPVPVVDLNKVGGYKLGHSTSFAVGDVFVSFVKNGKCVVEYSKRQLPLLIIKAQLEQILDHLGVKANIVIFK